MSMGCAGHAYPHLDCVACGDRAVQFLSGQSAAIVRDATTTDLPAIVGMAQRFLRETPYHRIIRENVAQLETFAINLLASPLGTILLLDVDGATVGLVALLAVPHYLSGDLIATEVCWWVNPEQRGKGRLLLAAAEDWARDRGAVALQMIAPEPRLGVMYERAGFIFVESAYQKSW